MSSILLVSERKLTFEWPASLSNVQKYIKERNDMRNYQYLSTETLKCKRESLVLDIDQWEKLLASTHSALIRLSLGHYIKKAKEQIHLIDAELCYRKDVAVQ